MKIDIKGDISEFEDSLNIGEILCKLKYDSSVIGALVDGELRDMTYQPKKDSKIEVIREDSKYGLDLIRHTAAHVLAEAVQGVYPDTKVTIGPVIENGFYYDFSTDRTFSEDDLVLFEKRMSEIIKNKKVMTRKLIGKKDAISQFKKMGENFKEEIINDLEEDEEISLYYQGDWFDLCRGPHAPNTSYVKAFKLLSVAGSYWRGDEKRESLQRIYGTAFFNKKDLKKHLLVIEEAKKRDHRKLGKELNLFSITDDVGPGLVLWHPNGATVRNIIENYWRDEHISAGYEIVYTPHLAKADIWETSGHSEFYKENMFSEIEIDKNRYQTKPMNCPFHIMYYKSSLRSYRDLPMKIGELGTVYRYERGGTLHGMLRVRGFTQDDAHIFCTPDQIEAEIDSVLDLTFDLLGAFGFDDFTMNLSTKPTKAVGSDEQWEVAENSLKKTLDARNLEYEVEEEGGAFYGPKIDVNIKDAIGRSWQCTTVQFDFNLPQRFGLTYIGEDGNSHQPYMVHRAIFGSLERFMGILIEHYGGSFPTWLAPTQVQIIPIADRHIEYGLDLQAKMRDSKIRSEIDTRSERMNSKVRDAQLAKIPYMFIVGDRELESETVGVRMRS